MFCKTRAGRLPRITTTRSCHARRRNRDEPVDRRNQAVYCVELAWLESGGHEAMMNRRHGVIVLALCLFAGCGTAGSAQTTLRASAKTQDALDAVSTKVMRKEIELMQMTTLFRMNNKRESNLHKWTVATLSTCAYSIADAGNIVTFTNGFRYHTHPQNFGIGRAEAGPFLIFLGELFFVARTTSTVAVDLFDHAVKKNRGFDKKTYEAHASQLRTEIQNLLKERASLAGTSDAVEQLLLTNLAAAADAEFIGNYSRAAQLETYRLWDDIFANYTSGTGAFAGGLPTYLAGVESRPGLTGPGGIGFILSGSGFIVDHALARAVSLEVEKRSVARLGGRALDPLALQASIRQQIDQLSATTPPDSASAARRTGYAMLLACLEQQTRLDARERQRDRRKFWHDQIFDSVEGSANIAAGTIICNAGLRYHPDNTAAIPLNLLSKETGARHFLTRFAWGAATFTPTATAGIIDTPGEALLGEFFDKYDTRRGISADAVLNKRLTTLEAAARLLPAS